MVERDCNARADWYISFLSNSVLKSPISVERRRFHKLTLNCIVINSCCHHVRPYWQTFIF